MFFFFRFKLATLLKNHFYSVHREKEPYITCEICGKSFSAKTSFDNHMLSHADKSERLAQRKKCEHCGEWLMSKSGMYYHEQIHSIGEFKCDKCPTILPNKIALSAHFRKYHREHNFICSYCNKSFSVSSQLKVNLHLILIHFWLTFETLEFFYFIHYKIALFFLNFFFSQKHEESHTRHNVYPCQFCKKEFTLRTSQLTHQKRSHMDELKQLRETRKRMKHSF